MIVAVHGGLRQGLAAADLQRGLEPRDLDDLLERIRSRGSQVLFKFGKPLLRICFENRRVGVFFGLFVLEGGGPRACNPKVSVLHKVNMMQPLVKSPILQRGRIRLKGAPVLSVGPFLVGVERAQILMHRVAAGSSVYVLAWSTQGGRFSRLARGLRMRVQRCQLLAVRISGVDRHDLLQKIASLLRSIPRGLIMEELAKFVDGGSIAEQ